MPNNRALYVSFLDQACGVIEPQEGLQYEFTYAPAWLASQRRGISLSLTPQTAPFPSVTARAFFGGLLPEGAARRHISQTYGVDDLDDIALLRLIGHECAGAIRVTSAPVEPGSSRRLIRWMEPDEVRE
ncbi:MAG: HipA N-terminal domain-containing protein, partial [Thermoleophilia bacterium]|nr:HipA N-terminal domain-containing protein [Thermoleophilia bacterium]